MRGETGPTRKSTDEADDIVTTTCASHCGGACRLKVHVKDGQIHHIETDDGEEPQLRGCLRGRSYRQRVYDPHRILYPLKRVGARGEGKFERISWDEAIDAVAKELLRVRDTYGPASILLHALAGDLGQVHSPVHIGNVLALLGGYTNSWGQPSFHQGGASMQYTYGTFSASNSRDNLLDSRLIIMWGWNPASTITGVNSHYFLAKAREAGAKIVAVDPRLHESAATLADQWIPIRPATDAAMLLAIAYVLIAENLFDQQFLDTYTVGFEQFRDYVMGVEDGPAKTPGWAEAVTGVPAATIVRLAREYGTIKPAALIAGVGPGRTSFGEQYHRIAITLSAMTGNVGIPGGDPSSRSWESIVDYPYKMIWGYSHVAKGIPNPIRRVTPPWRARKPFEWAEDLTEIKLSDVHRTQVPDFIEKGKAGGFAADCKLVAVVNNSYLNNMPNSNKIARALKSKNLEFMFILEQVMTPTAKHADIILPTNTFLERDDMVRGVGLAYYSLAPKVIDSLGESKSQNDIGKLLARRLGLTSFPAKTDQEWIDDMLATSEIPDIAEFKRTGFYRVEKEPCLAFKKQIEDPEHNPFPTLSGKIEIYSKRLEERGDPGLPPVPKYIADPEGWNSPLRKKYPLQLITSHQKNRANNQYHDIPWLNEVEGQSLLINPVDAEARGIKDGDLVRIFNDRGVVAVPARVSQRIMIGAVDLPHGAWYAPDEKGIDRGGCPNTLCNDVPSPSGGFAYNSCLVEVELMSTED